MDSECHIRIATVIDNSRCRNTRKSEIICLHSVWRGAIVLHRCIITVSMSAPLCDWSLPSRLLSVYIAIRKTSLLLRTIRAIQKFILYAASIGDLLRLLRSFYSLMIGNTTRDYAIVQFTQYFMSWRRKVYVPEEIDRDCLCLQLFLLFHSTSVCNVRHLVIDIQLSVKIIEFIIDKICRTNTILIS